MKRSLATRPDIGLLVPFYAIGMYHVTKDERKGKSLEYKAQKCRMLGYDDQCKNTLVIVCIPGGKIISRKDCIFDERLRDMYTFDDMCEEMDDFDYTRINFDDPIDPHNDGVHVKSESMLYEHPTSTPIFRLTRRCMATV